MKRVAIFDCDDTLIHGDSLMPFLVYAAGRARAYAALAIALAGYPLHGLRNRPQETLRTYLKSRLLHRLLKGKRRADLAAATAQIMSWRKINPPMIKALQEHKEKGDVIVIASGSLDLYLPELLYDMPYDALICTTIGIEDGVITGCMTQGNCVRQRKAERIREWLDANGPFEESFGYGNYPHDVPMLNLVKHRIIVS